MGYSYNTTWNSYKKYIIPIDEEFIDLKKVSLYFELNVLCELDYKDNYMDVTFDDDTDYEYQACILYYNNGKKLIEIDIEDLVEELEKASIALNDIKSIKTFLNKKKK